MEVGRGGAFRWPGWKVGSFDEAISKEVSQRGKKYR